MKKDDQQEKAENGFTTSFTKRFKLNKEIDLNEVKAQMNDGSLTITLPKVKVKKAARKEIPIVGYTPSILDYLFQKKAHPIGWAFYRACSLFRTATLFSSFATCRQSLIAFRISCYLVSAIARH